MHLHIVLCAMKLFRKHGFEHTTMERVADEADVAKRTLYSYFSVKEAIVSAYWLYNAEKKAKWLPLLYRFYPDTRKRLKKIFLDGAKGFQAEPEYARIHFSYQFQKIGQNTSKNIQSDFDDVLSAVIKVGQDQGEIRDDFSATLLAHQLMLNFTAVSLLWFSDTTAFSLDDRLSKTVDFFIDGAGRS